VPSPGVVAQALDRRIDLIERCTAAVPQERRSIWRGMAAIVLAE
jgi:hypothetical protein